MKYDMNEKKYRVGPRERYNRFNSWRSSTKESTLRYSIDNIYIDERKILIHGWATSVRGNDAVKINLFDSFNHLVKYKCSKTNRKDLVETGLVDEKNIFCGFYMEIARTEVEDYTLTIEDGLRKKYIVFNEKKILKKQKVRSCIDFVREASKHIKPSAMREISSYVKKNGVKNLKKYIVTRLHPLGKPYKQWYEEHAPSQEELNEERRTVFEKMPKISIIVPAYRTPVHFLCEMMDSIRNQSYQNWELCIADGSEGNSDIESELKRYHQKDSRIKYRILDKNLGISGNTNAALEMATGTYVGLCDHDDLLALNALYEVVKALQEKDYDILYTDEDKISGNGKEHMDPNFKPDFSIDSFRSRNYIAHFFVVKSEIIREVGGFRSEYDGSQDYDVMFRCMERAKSVKHIPIILYHWRMHRNSVAEDPESKMYAYEAGKRAIEDHLQRMGVKATVEHTELWGMYHVKYATPGDPLVSILIPNKDHIEDLKTCISSIYKKSRYQNYEIIIIENNSEEQKTFDFYEYLKKTHENIKVVTWRGEFNYAAINNYGVQSASGEYLLFLNNDTEMISQEAIAEMLGCCMREEVGAVGAKLLYGDNTVQHAGVVLGFRNYAGHVNTGIDRDDYGYMARARSNCNYSAVTAACMMTKKTLFKQVGGFDEQFAVACNDVDYCLKLREVGKTIVFNAFSEWYHYESRSRGYEDSWKKIRRFEREVEKFQKKWRKVLDEGDPYYNKNFPITQAPFTLG